jgi:O-antigen/teichoic acid export membrane protein
VNHFFPAQDAGLYAAAAVLGKAVLYLPGGIALALFPMVVEQHARRQETRSLFLQALLLVGLVCTAGATFYLVAGRWLVQLLYGAQYAEAGELLRYYGFAILPMTLVMVAEYFLIAKGRILFAYIFVIIAPLQTIAVYLWHDSLVVVIGIMGGFGALLACLGLALLWPRERAARA